MCHPMALYCALPILGVLYLLGTALLLPLLFVIYESEQIVSSVLHAYCDIAAAQKPLPIIAQILALFVPYLNASNESQTGSE